MPVSRVSCRYPGPRESGLSCLFTRFYSWFIVLTQSLLTVRLAITEIKPVQSQTDKLTDGQTTNFYFFFWVINNKDNEVANTNKYQKIIDEFIYV